VEAVPAGARVTGRVAEAASAEAAEGRGRMTLAFEALELPGGGRASLTARPLAIRAPSSKRRDAGIIGGLAGVSAAVGGLLGGRGGAVAGAVVGGAAGVAIVTTDKGREVALAPRASLSVEVVAPVTVTRPK
jgi:hypothetical protein